MTAAPLARTSGWLLYRADEIQERDELANLGPVTAVTRSGADLTFRVCVGNVRYVDVEMGADTEVLARKPRSYAPPTTAQFSQMRPVSMSPVVMPPFTGGRQIGDPLARSA